MKSKHSRQKGNSSRTGSGKDKAEQPIPRKRKGGDEKGKPRKFARDDREPLKGDHFCTKCKKWSPYAKYMHDTKDCKHWDAHGTDLYQNNCKARVNTQRSNQISKLQHEKTKRSEMTKCFAQMREDHAELMKKSSPGRTKRKIASLVGRITMLPPAAIVTPAEILGPMILVIVVKM